MSGIYGFTYHSDASDHIVDAMEGLTYWNRIYGREDHAGIILDRSALGCCIEHFSDRFPHGTPISEDGDQYAVVDALLYNRDELLPILQLPDDSLISDEALLLKLISEKGFEILSQVNGDFAGAIFDKASDTWRLFRDHLGVRPLYLYRDEHIFGFSTDIRGLLSIPGTKTDVNEDLIYANLIGAKVVTLKDTDFAHVVCAHPGAVTTVRMTPDGFDLQESVYWRPRRKKVRLKSEQEYRERLRELITDAVKRRCDAIPGTLGAELSGGLDSGVIDILINRLGRSAKFYSWSQDPLLLPLNPVADERQVILDICKQENIECRFKARDDGVRVNSNKERILPPFVNTQNLSYSSSWLREQGVRVVFSGHGGDEGVSHRASRYELFYNREFYHYFKLYWHDLKGRKLRLVRAIRSGLLEARKRRQEIHTPTSRQEYLHDVFHDRFAERMALRYREAPVYFNYAPHKYVMQGGTRNRLDNTAYQGALNGVRYLFPYVDYRVMDYALSVPRWLYISNEGNRMLFREAFRDLMPASLYDVHYKDAPSLSGSAEKIDRSSIFERNFSYLLNNLDRDFWAEVLDFRKIEQMKSPEINHKYMPAKVYLLIHHLGACELIQKVHQYAKKWRELDEQDEIL